MTVFRLLPRFVCIAALVLGVSVENASGQSLKRSSGPAELPPSSFQGNQYVDSKGCAFIRAGYSGRVSWIPRVSRSRKLLCGFRPTFVNRSQVVSQPRAAEPVRRVVQPKVRTVERPRNTAVRAAPSVATTGELFRSSPSPQINPSSRAAPRVAPTDLRIAPCVGASALSSKYINRGAGVRCGPQKGKSRTVIRTETLRQGNLDNTLRGPKGTNRRIAQARTIKVPKGYRAVHKDGRLNPLRGVGTTSGQTQMAAIWSNTVPRYLIDPATGKPLK